MASLLSPLKIRGMGLSNRIVMPPMANQLATSNGQVEPELIKHYLGRPGVGLIIVEHSYILPEGKVSERQLGIYSDELIPGLKKMVEAVHREGNLIGIQITHAGSTTNSEMIGKKPLAPTAIKHPGRQQAEEPEELTLEQLEQIKEAFVQAALRVREAGFDMVEIHGAHGYLLNQFFSPLTNKREDQYGGSLENRLRFPIEVVKAVREALDDDFPLFYRLGSDDFLPGGLTVADGVKAAPLLAEAGVDVIDLSGGLRGYTPAGDKEGQEGKECFFLYLSQAIKPVTEACVMVTGGIKTARLADNIISNGDSDLVGIGRALLKDKLWARKAINELEV